MTVDEMLDRMSSFELSEWRALYAIRAAEAKDPAYSRSFAN